MDMKGVVSMQKCPHAKGTNGCNALLNNGFSPNTIVISENWWHRFCSGDKHRQCPNLKAALSMKEEKERKSTTGSYVERKEGPSGVVKNTSSKINKPKANKNKRNVTPVHAHGGKPPHFCERPWRTADLRFRITQSEFYTRPWIS